MNAVAYSTISTRVGLDIHKSSDCASGPITTIVAPTNPQNNLVSLSSRLSVDVIFVLRLIRMHKSHDLSSTDRVPTNPAAMPGLTRPANDARSIRPAHMPIRPELHFVRPNHGQNRTNMHLADRVRTRTGGDDAEDLDGRPKKQVRFYHAVGPLERRAAARRAKP